MDAALGERLREGARALGVALPEESIEPLLAHLALLLKWNKTINLTAVVDPLEVVEKHLLDSLAVAAWLPAGKLLDVGTGAGFPGIPVALVRPDIEVVLVDSVGKKVSFLKNALAALGLVRCRALAVRLAGEPEAERVPICDAAVARAFAAPAEWLGLAQHYVRPGGAILCMLGPRDELPQRQGRALLEESREYALPFSGSARRLARYRVE